MMATAHPDDENNGLLVMLNRGQGYRTALATATRGNGGQNEIGPEIFEALGVLRTEELAALHRFDGAEQYFTRAVDFGFSFSVDETFEKWGHDEVLGDFVRLIRTIRPDVMAGLSPTGIGGGQHHQASAMLAREAFKARRRSDEVSRADPRGAASVAAEEALLHDRLRRTVRPERRAAGAHAVDQPVGLRPAARQDLRRDRHRSAQHAQVPGHGAAAVAARVRCRLRITSSSRRSPARWSATEAGMFDGVDSSIAGLAQFAGAQRADAS